jgi:ATP-dependent DNA helicase RecG
MPFPETREEILERIRLGEDSFFEIKSVHFAGAKVSGPRRDAFADELAAFANAAGGVCILGVDDSSREVSGIPVELLDATEAFVREVANDSIEPPLLLEIERMTLPSAGGERAVLKVSVDRSLFVHKSPGGYFHRVGSSKREMRPDFLARLFQQRSQSRIIRFDEQLVPECSVDDLDAALTDRFRTGRSDVARMTFLQKLGMVGKENGNLRPTVAGVLLGTRDPRRWLPNAFIQAVAYIGDAIGTGDDAPYQLDALDITGPLDQQVADASRFVYRNMRTAATKKMGRTDLPQYDLTAIFEAVVNAVAHRDYSVYGSKIRLRMFSDRLELYSPGSLANTMDVESLEFRQSARNETVTSLLAKCPVPELDWVKTSRATMMDRRGEGVSLIFESSERLSGRRPVYDLFDDAELRLTIFAANL